MKYFPKLLSRQFYRSIHFWLLLFVLNYTLVGFLLIPNIVQKTLVKQVSQQLGWQTDIESVQFNPYTFTLTVNNLKISDQKAQEQLSFQRYYMNFETRSIIEGAFTFAEIELVNAYVNVDLDKNGISNFQSAMQQQLEKNPPIENENENESEEAAESSLPKLLFDNINVIDGSIDITDNTPTKTVKHQINPLTFNLKNLFTYGEKEGNYHLNIALGKGQTITWDGTLGITPLRSNGSLNITGFRVHDFWDYLSEQAPYTLQNALVGITGEYEFTMANEPMQLNVHKGSIQIDKIQLANKQQDKNFATVDAINLGPLDFNLAEKKLQIKTVKIDNVDLEIKRDKQGLINLLAPFINTEKQNIAKDSINNLETNKTADSPKAVVSNSPFQWSVNNIILNNSRINFIDDQPSTPAQINVDEINFNIKELTQDLSQPHPFNLSYNINHASTTTVNGQVVAEPLNLQANLSINDLGLPALQPYINDVAKINLEQGRLSIKGEINLANNQQGEIKGDFKGVINVDEFNTKDIVQKQRLVGWQSLAVDPITVNFNPLSIAVNKVVITKPYSRLIITKDRSVNLAQLALKKEQQLPADNTQKNSEEKTDNPTVAEQPIDIKINNITLKDGGAYFADLSLKPQFGTSIQNINGEINGLSSENLARADVNISGTIEKYGEMLVKGKINPLSGDLYTDINADFKQIELAALTPYSGRHVGYAIDKGKLNLNLNYKIANNTLDASNHIVLNQFELGQTVKSDEAVSLPLKLALALFRDSDGVIDLEVPISGDMDSPDFAIGGLIIKGLLNLITKAVTSPFSMIANLVGGDADELNSLAFNLGSATLTKANIEQLNTLANVLKKRPSLTIEVRAIVDEQQDTLALKEIKMQKLLRTSGVSNDVTQETRIAILEQLLTQYNGQKELAQLQSKMQSEIIAAQEINTEKQPLLITNEYEQSLQSALLNKQPLSNLELTNLAQQRLNVIKGHLIETGEVENKQVFALQPSLEGKAENKQISTIFTLTSN